MTHPAVSSMMAEAISAIPTFRRMKPISRTTIATIFTEAIDNAVPRKSEVMIRWSGLGSIAAGNSSPSANPQAKGTIIPAADVLMAARRAFLTSLRSVSIPVSSNSIRMPSCETASIMLCCCGLAAKTARCASGQIAPNTEGPSRIPAISCPMTAGCPIRCIASPIRRPTRSSRTICARKSASDGACIRVLRGERAVFSESSAPGSERHRENASQRA